MAAPIIEQPLYVNGAPLPEGAASSLAEKARPLWGVAGIALVSAVAGYFVPKILDRMTGEGLSRPLDWSGAEWDIEQ